MYRDPQGPLWASGVDPSDGSCWAILGATLVHLDAAGNTLQKWSNLEIPRRLAVNTADGSCWVADRGLKQIIHFSHAGAELGRADYDAGALAVNQTDGSLWLSQYVDSDQIALVHLSTEGAETVRVATAIDAHWVSFLAVNPQDGSCWLAGFDYPALNSWTLTHYASDGTQLWQFPTAGPCLSLNPTDGSVWTAGYTFVPGSGDTAGLFRVSADNQVLWSRTFDSGNALPYDLAVDPSSGNCWCRLQNHMGDLLLLSPSDGSQVSQITVPGDRQLGSGETGALSLNPADGSLWVGANSAGVIHLSSTGAALGQDLGLPLPTHVVVNPADGSYWFVGGEDCDPDDLPWIARFDAAGHQLWQSALPAQAADLVLDTADASVWVVAGGYSEHPAVVEHFAADGTPLPSLGDYSKQVWVSLVLDPRDRSLWVASNPGQGAAGGQLDHCLADGTLLHTYYYYWWLDGIQIANDGSFWTVASQPWTNLQTLAHITPDGTFTEFDNINVPVNWKIATSEAVNPQDGSVWIDDQSSDGTVFYVSHFDATGKLLGRASGKYPWCDLAVDSRTGNCWAFGGDQIWIDPSVAINANGVHLPLSVISPSGQVLDTLGEADLGESRPIFLTVNPANGQPWILDIWCPYRIISAAPFSDVAAGYWATPSILACVNAGLVAGYTNGTYQPSVSVTRDQMAAYIARALAGGDANVPAYTGTPHFTDVPAGNWALKYVEYAYAQNVVQGYADGSYAPAGQLNRGQMAAFIARALVAPGGDAAIPVPTGSATFTDVSSSFGFYKQIEYIAHTTPAVTVGYGDGTYQPDTLCTRDQMAVFVQRAFHLPVS